MLSIRSVIEDLKTQFHLTLVGGEKGLDRKFKWISLAEDMETLRTLSRHELVFSTGIMIHSEEMLMEMIREAQMSSLAGIVFQGNPCSGNFGKEVEQFCNFKNFPCLLISSEDNWPLFVKEVMERAIMQENKKLRFGRLMETLHNEMDIETTTEILIKDYSFPREGDFTVYCLDLTNMEQSRRGKVELAIDDVMISFQSKAWGPFPRGFIIVFWDEDELGNEQFSRLLIDYVKNQRDDIRLGIGNTKKGIASITSGISEALNVIELQSQNTRQSFYYYNQPIRLLNMLTTYVDPKVLQEYIDNNIGNLIQYDRDQNTNYLEVIEVYFKNNGSVKDTSEEMFVHRNTINYSIQKIKKILDCPEFETLDRMNIYVAVLLYGHLNK